MELFFELNPDLIVVSRDLYTVLDWLSDIGGIHGMMISAVAIVIGYLNYNFFDNFLVQRLYRIRGENIPDQTSTKKFNASK